MTLSPRARRLIAYPLSVAVAVSVWCYGFGAVEADVETLVSAASVRAEMAQQIDAGSPDGAALRARLLAEAENLAARAAAVEPEAALVLETKAFLALLDGQAVEAARLYGAARGAGDCDSVHRDLLVAAEAKAWSNAGQVERALRVLDESEEPAHESVALDRETLRIRLYARSGQQDAAVAHTLSLWAKPWADASAAALQLIGAMGAGDLAASAARNAQWQRALQDYFLARLKLQSGDTDTAGSLLERSLETGDQEVTRHFQRDRDLWVTGIGTERIDRFMTPRAELATPPGAR